MSATFLALNKRNRKRKFSLHSHPYRILDRWDVHNDTEDMRQHDKAVNSPWPKRKNDTLKKYIKMRGESNHWGKITKTGTLGGSSEWMSGEEEKGIVCQRTERWEEDKVRVLGWGTGWFTRGEQSGETEGGGETWRLRWGGEGEILILSDGQHTLLVIQPVA